VAVKLSPQAARARLELLLPNATDTLGEILESFAEAFRAGQFEGDERRLTVNDRVKLARELRAIAAQILDRGGVPVTKQVKTEQTRLSVHVSNRELVAEIARKFKRLEPEDRELLISEAPQILDVVKAGDA